MTAPLKAYIDVHGAKRRLLLKPVEITMYRAEGLIAQCGPKGPFLTYHAAYWYLLGAAKTVTPGGCYDKHDFKVTFEDGYEYSGRFDLMHTSRYGVMGPRVQDHMREMVEWLATDPRAVKLHGDGIVEEAVAFLSRYDVGQRPPYLEHDCTDEIDWDYRKGQKPAQQGSKAA